MDKVFSNKYGSKKQMLDLDLVFREEHLPHLIGLDKLTDIRSYIFDKRAKKDIHNAIIQREIIETEILNSSLLHSTEFGNYTIYDRISYFPIFLELFLTHSHNIYEYIDVRKDTTINADFAIKYPIENSMNNMYLFIKKDTHNRELYIPISFFPSELDKYFKGKKIWKLLLSEVKNSQGEISIIYKNPSYQ